MEKIETQLIRLIGYVCSWLFFLMVAVSLLQVFFRYILNDSLTWSEELARYLFVWISFLGAVVALYRGMHIEVDVITAAVSKKTRRRMAVIAQCCVLTLLLVLIFFGIRIVSLTWHTPSAALHVPMALVYLSIPVGAFAMLIVSVFQMIRIVRPQLDSNE